MWAKDADTEKINIGLEISPSFTWLNIDNGSVDPDGGKMKFNGSLNVYFNLTNNYALKTGLGFNTYGGNLEGESNATIAIKENFTYNFQEIEVPFALKLRTNSFDEFRFTATIGVGMGIMVNGHATKNSGEARYKKENYDYSLFPIRALYNLGIGTEYNLKGTILMARLNYKGSFSNLYFYDNGWGRPSNNLDLHISSKQGKMYDEKIIFRPSAFELVVGVLF